jgi:molybdopterin-guanine dinucleotide biosynthesis protein A
MSQVGQVGLVLLTGGTSRRFGSDKSQAQINGRSIFDFIVGSIPDSIPLIIVGPDPKTSTDRDFTVVSENPPSGGPVAGLMAGLAQAKFDLLILLATDMPFALSYVLSLMDLLEKEDDAILFQDSKGFLQPLAGIYRRSALVKRFTELGDPTGESMRRFISTLKIQAVTMTQEVETAFIDIDTPADYERAIAIADSLRSDDKSKMGGVL